MKWHWRYAYVNSTHSALPKRLNASFETVSGEKTSGVLLHTKFLETIVEKSKEEKIRKQHFSNSELYRDYYDQIIASPTLWNEQSVEYKDWRQLEELGLISCGGWA